MINRAKVIEQEINNFHINVNKNVDKDNSFFYKGPFITGKFNSPKYLFLSINPGYGINEWDQREKLNFVHQNFTEEPCKYLEEYQCSCKLGSKIKQILLKDDASLFEHCVETYMTSFFSTPDVNILDKQLALLDKIDLEKHQEIMNKIIDFSLDLNPDHIICIGFKAFDEAVSKFKLDDVETLREKNRRFYASATLSTKRKNITVHGVIHLSGGMPSNNMTNEIKNIFDRI